MQIRGRPIGPSHPPYVIAEVSCNHAGSEAVAMALIQVAKDAGAEAVKFQFYTPEGMVGSPVKVVDVGTGGIPQANPHALRQITEGPWAGTSPYTLYASAAMPWEWGPRLKARCHDLGLAFIASAYDMDGLNWLMQNCVPDALKVASFEATDTPFVEAMATKGLPLIVSLGMCDWDEKWAVYRHLRNTPNGDAENFVLLHCVSAYPTLPQDADLDTLEEVPVKGFSDHTRGHAVACAAVAKGACVLEKHIQLHAALKTADSHFSVTPSEFVDYCMAVEDAWLACQPVVGDPEKDSRQFRRAPGGKRGSYGQ